MAKVSVTVAAVIQNEGRYLLVEEQTEDGIRINQPAGHLEPDESIVEGAVRETLEETAYGFSPDGLVGIYRWRHPANGVTYVRFAVLRRVGSAPRRSRPRPGILRTLWLTPEQLRSSASTHRSPLVLRCVEDHLAGRRYSLDMLIHYP